MDEDLSVFFMLLRNATSDWRLSLRVFPLLQDVIKNLKDEEAGTKDGSTSSTTGISESINQLRECQSRVHENPYTVSNYVQLSGLYELLEYNDLAAGEAYKGILLTDELSDESSEYHNVSVAANTNDYEQQHEAKQSNIKCLSWVQEVWLPKLYTSIVRNLVACGCFRSAFELSCRGRTSLSSSSGEYEGFHAILLENLKRHCHRDPAEDVKHSVLLNELIENGRGRRELYPWNDHEKCRHSQESLDSINDHLAKVAPSLEARVAELPFLRGHECIESLGTSTLIGEKTIQLGLFARTNLTPGETILNEKSLLTASARLLDTVCDGCSVSIEQRGINTDGSQSTYCPDCEITVFCSSECLQEAQNSYHVALCGKDVESIAKDAPLAKAADNLYSLLLLRAMAMAEAQNVHPLDLSEVRFIWGGYHQIRIQEACAPGELAAGRAFGSIPRTLPFSFESNILLPLHMLEKMDVNIFDSAGKYDLWVLNTLYAKFRGTASARQGPNGKPEVGAVHPLWCLANHSCDPNVAWDWQGSIRFWVRDKRKVWKGKEKSLIAGIKIDEEILSHYTDVDLEIKDRREWAAGALGGLCMCDRCKWEERNNNKD